MKGQASVEYLALALISIALLSVSILALAGMKSEGERTLRVMMLGFSGNRLADAANEVCAMGNGNSRSVMVQVPLSIDSRPLGDAPGYVARFSGAGTSMATALMCESEDANLLPGQVLVSNKEGTVVFRAS
jgi:hypothetical protein